MAMSKTKSKMIAANEISNLLNTIKNPLAIITLLELLKEPKTTKELLKIINTNKNTNKNTDIDKEQLLRKQLRSLQHNNLIKTSYIQNVHNKKSKNVKLYHLTNKNISQWLLNSLDFIQ
jgi:hypothetical protein